ncbi:hypothetical protein PI125_g15737 [Phytophthora idaei]|nr:hypothetical protein PI125_g15737 [Phytophthora idaei]
MRQAFIALLMAIVLLATCGAASLASDSINQFQSSEAADNNKITSDPYELAARVLSKKRAINVKKLFDVKKWLIIATTAKITRSGQLCGFPVTVTMLIY